MALLDEVAKARRLHYEIEDPGELSAGGCSETVKLVRVHPGYRCGFQAEIDKDGNILSIGSYDE